MGENPSLLSEDYSLIVDAAVWIQRVKGSRIQAKAWMVFSLGPSNPWILGPQAFGFSRRQLNQFGFTILDIHHLGIRSLPILLNNHLII